MKARHTEIKVASIIHRKLKAVRKNLSQLFPQINNFVNSKFKIETINMEQPFSNLTSTSYGRFKYFSYNCKTNFAAKYNPTKAVSTSETQIFCQLVKHLTSRRF